MCPVLHITVFIYFSFFFFLHVFLTFWWDVSRSMTCYLRPNKYDQISNTRNRLGRNIHNNKKKETQWAFSWDQRIKIKLTLVGGNEPVKPTTCSS